MKYDVLKKSKLLKDWEAGDEADAKSPSMGNRNIFINQDESPLTRKENYRLRKERDRLRTLEENKNKKVVIYKGKLKVDDDILDEFKIENQILKA